MNFLKNLFKGKSTYNEKTFRIMDNSQIDKNIFILKDYRVNFQKSNNLNELSILLTNISQQSFNKSPRDGLLKIFNSLPEYLSVDFFNIFDFLIDEILEDNGKFLKKIQVLKQNVSDYRILSKFECFLGVAYIFMGFTNHLLLLFSIDHLLLDQGCILEKVKCILNYFFQFKNVFESTNKDYLYNNSLIIYRNVSHDFENQKTLSLLKKEAFQKNICLDNEFLDTNLVDSIEDLGQGNIESLFSNKMIGGNVLNKGYGQEEIKFLSNPELIAFLNYAEPMLDNETIYLIGSEKYNNVTGFLVDFKFDSNYFKIDERIKSKYFRINDKNILCNDSVIQSFNSFKYNDFKDNFKITNVERDLTKINSAFKNVTSLNEINRRLIITGKWGCGANRGNPELKFILQWIMSSILKRKIIFSCFCDISLYEKTQKLIKFICTKEIPIINIFSELEALQYISIGINFSLIDHLIQKYDDFKRSNTIFYQRSIEKI